LIPTVVKKLHPNKMAMARLSLTGRLMAIGRARAMGSEIVTLTAATAAAMAVAAVATNV
jgi:hypothetical protein